MTKFDKIKMMKKHWLFRALLLISLGILSAGCKWLPREELVVVSPTAYPENEFVELDLPIGYGYASRWIEIYFTDPADPKNERRQDGLDRVLIRAINKARVSVDIAVYSLNDYAISYAITSARERGVSVRVLVEGDNLGSGAVLSLIENGVDVKGDDHSGLMHNKFMIIDNAEVWTGSMNYTYESVYEDHNSLIKVVSPELVENYNAEFVELYDRKLSEPTIHTAILIGNIEVENYFSPDDRFAYRMVDLLDGVQNSARFMAYSFTADDYSEILIEKKAAGGTVEGIMESRNTKANGSDHAAMVEGGINMLPDKEKGLMHHKVFILDDETVVIGSYNFTAAAEKKNDENILIFKDPAIADIFNMEFERVWGRQ